jgi:hypothetical protein
LGVSNSIPEDSDLTNQGKPSYESRKNSESGPAKYSRLNEQRKSPPLGAPGSRTGIPGLNRAKTNVQASNKLESSKSMIL